MAPLCAARRTRTIGDNPETVPDPSGGGGCDHRDIGQTRTTRKLYRASDGKLVAGVAAGLAEHLRVDVLAVRIAFAVLAAAGGLGILAYAAFWAVVPIAPPATGAPAPPNARVQLPAIAAVAVGGMVLAGIAGVVFDRAVAWSLVLAAAGAGLIWWQADEAQRRRWARQLARPDGWTTTGRAAAARIALGLLLLVAGGGAFLASTNELQAAREGVVAIVVVVAGVAVLLAPWWWRLASELAAERRERIRSEERAAVAAHVHDSVLQTLTVIQRRADDPDGVRRLARAQERELRAWLYGRPAAATADRLSAALAAAAAEVEDVHDVRVEVVTVGDADLDERAGALVLAAREAMVNAAKFSGQPLVSVFAEVEPEALTISVRDTGAGFDPASIPADRRGVAESIIGRVARAGGTATIRSQPGAGTEVELVLPR